MKKLAYSILGCAAALAILFALPVGAAAPSASQTCGPSNATKECGQSGTNNGWVMGDIYSGTVYDMFWVQNGTEFLAFEDDGSDLKVSSASGDVEVQDALSVCDGACPTGATATGDGDLLVEDALEVDGATDLDGALTVAGATTASGTFNILLSGATAGWTVAAGANTACTTTCAGTGACLFGFDAGTTALVACATATADTCVCGGPAS